MLSHCLRKSGDQMQPYTQTLIKGLVVILAVAMTAERKKVVVK